MTSLTGFEALLRGKAVFTYGLPFYAGWGLTQDRHAHPRRHRRLSIDELVAAALIGYGPPGRDGQGFSHRPAARAVAPQLTGTLPNAVLIVENKRGIITLQSKSDRARPGSACRSGDRIEPMQRRNAVPSARPGRPGRISRTARE